jgi:hypothetical protein
VSGGSRPSPLIYWETKERRRTSMQGWRLRARFVSMLGRYCSDAAMRLLVLLMIQLRQRCVRCKRRQLSVTNKADGFVRRNPTNCGGSAVFPKAAANQESRTEPFASPGGRAVGGTPLPCSTVEKWERTVRWFGRSGFRDTP